MSRRALLPTGAAARALMLAAGLLSSGSVKAADAEAGRALMGLAEDRQRAQDAARVLDRLGAPASPRPAAVAATEPRAAAPAAMPGMRPAEAPALPRPAPQAAVDTAAPRPKAPSSVPASSPSAAVMSPSGPTLEAAPTKPTVALPAPTQPRVAPPSMRPEPAPGLEAAGKPAEREARQPAAAARIPDTNPEKRPVAAILPPPRESAPAARPNDLTPPRREPPAAVLAARPPEATAPVRPPLPAPIAAPVVSPMPPTEVYFGYGSVALSDESVAALLPLGEDRAGIALVTIVGHADALEKDTLDRRFSERRAEAVRRFLVTTLGFDPKRLVVRGVGAERPKVQGDLPSPQNRRVEILPGPVSPPSGRPSPDRPSSDRGR